VLHCPVLAGVPRGRVSGGGLNLYWICIFEIAYIYKNTVPALPIPIKSEKVVQENVKLLTNLTFCLSFTTSPTGTEPEGVGLQVGSRGKAPVGDLVKLKQNVKLVSNFTFSCKTFFSPFGKFLNPASRLDPTGRPLARPLWKVPGSAPANPFCCEFLGTPSPMPVLQCQRPPPALYRSKR